MNGRQVWARSEAIVATGMPGLYRMLAFVCVQKVYTLGDLGRAASAFSVAQMLSFFTAIGWAGLILVRVPAARDRQAAVNRVYELVPMSAVTLIAVSGAVVAITAALAVELSGLEIVAILAGWTAYQLARHYFLARREYRRAIAYDLVLLAVSGLYVVCAHRLDVMAGVALGAALATTALLMFAGVGRPRPWPVRSRFETKGLEFGLTNFLSGGIALSLVPVANFTEGPVFAGVVSLIASFCAISALVPRAITLYRLPALSRLADAGRPLGALTAQTAREIALASGVTFVVNAVVVAGIAFHEMPASGFRYGLACGLALAAQAGISMLGMAYSSVLMVREEGRESALINLVACGSFVGVLAAYYRWAGVPGFPLVLAVCIAVTLLRNRLLKVRSVRFLSVRGGER